MQNDSISIFPVMLYTFYNKIIFAIANENEYSPAISL